MPTTSRGVIFQRLIADRKYLGYNFYTDWIRVGGAAGQRHRGGEDGGLVDWSALRPLASCE